jgi:hypothetical protein
MEKADLIEKYIAQLTPAQIIVYNIAKTNLETSFSIEKSIGFIEFVKNIPVKEKP